MDEWLDISVPVTAESITWPGMPAPAIQLVKSFAAGDEVENSVLRMDVHTGTHLDAPRHHVPDGSTVGAFDLAQLCGPAVVVDVGEVEMVTAEVLSDHEEAIPAGYRLLIRSTNGQLWEHASFEDDYVALDASAAGWITARDILLVGIDYLSIESFGSDGRVHRCLLGEGVAVLEGLDLRAAPPGAYLLLCLPLSLPGSEAAPARAVLAPSTVQGAGT